MNRVFRALALLFFSSTLISQLNAQVTTGTPPFGSFAGGPDVINLANLNSHITIPVLHKAGRGTDFTYDLSYDSAVWYPTLVTGVNTWQQTGGWRGVTEIMVGYVTNKSHRTKCPVLGDGFDVIYDTYVYHDTFGTSHAFSGQSEIDCNGLFTGFTATTGDGSGYTLTTTDVGAQTVVSSSGTQYYPPLNLNTGVANYTDRNGNKITLNSSGQFFDTTSTTAPVLTVTGSGTTASPLKFTYTSSTGTSPFVQINYANYTVATNFGVSGISEYKSTAAVPLVSSIVLPDNSQYSFTYEPTPGTCTPYAGTTCVTARVKVITLPTGGTITYNYSGGNNGILPDGSTATLTRTTSDGVWVYAQVKNTSPATTTTVTDPASPSNQTVINFEGMYETQRKVYSGPATGTPLTTVNTCYNAAASPCTTTAITLPITQRTVKATIPGSAGLQSQHTDKFDAYGNTTESDDYDFATVAPFPLLRQTLVTYAGLGAYLHAFRQTVIVKDGSGVIKSRQDTNYDQYSSFTGGNCINGAPNHDDTGHGCSMTSRANPTSTTTYTDPVTPSGAITKNFTYDSLGNLRTAQVNCCENKTWTYISANAYAYPDTVTSGTSSPQLKTTLTYDLHMGLVLTSTDPNNLLTTLTYDNMGRTLTSKVGSWPVTQYTYTDTVPWSVKACSPVQNTDLACQNSILDGYGRTITSQFLDGTSSLKSATDTQYDSFGRAYKVSNPYNSGSGSQWTQTYFDVLGRVWKTTAPDNSATTITYTDNTVTTADPANVQRKAVSDGLGRMTSVYEPDPLNSNTLTLQTSYTYNVFDQLTQVTQGAQTRTYNYDALSRLTSTTTPEAGKVCFGSMTGSTCNADGYDQWNNLLKRSDARGVLTNYGYDTLNRLTSVNYNVGTSGVTATPSVTLSYGIDPSCNAAHGMGCIGQVITTTDGAGSENYTYNSLEQITTLSKVIGTTTYPINYAYNYAGELTSITYPSGRVITQGLDTIGRLASVSDTTTTYANGFAYNAANQPTGFKYGNNIYASIGYSTDRLQLTCLDYSTTNRAGTCQHDATTKFGITPTYPAAGGNNGFFSGITDSVDAGRTAAYTYDSLYRLSTAATTGSTNYPKWGLSMTYDRYGNRTAQSIASGCVAPMTCPTSSITVSTTNNHLTGSPYSYDLNGNMTNDGSNTLVYDAENRTLSATNGSTSGAYTYDGNNLRVKKVSGSITTVYLFSGPKVIAEYVNGAAPTAPTREYIYSGGALIAKIETGATKYYHQDHLSNRLVTDSSGNVSSQIGHFPYGESWYNATGDKLMFTSYERDAESGNDYAMARYYISRLGRFASPDKVSGSAANPQSLNRYSYVLNNPGGLVDPSGNCGQMYETRGRKKFIHTGEGGRFLPFEEFEGVFGQDPVIDDCFGDTYGGGGGGYEVPLGDGTTCLELCTIVDLEQNLPSPPPPDSGSTSPSLPGDFFDPASSAFAIGGVGFLGGMTGNAPGVKQIVCALIPDGRTEGTSGAAGTLGGPAVGAERVLNYNTGEVSMFTYTGGFGGFNGGGSLSLTGGLISGLGNSNSSYSGPFTTVSGGYGLFGGFESAAGTPKTGWTAPTVVGVAISKSLFGKGSGTVSVTNYSSPKPAGNFVTGSASANTTDRVMYRVRQICK